MLVTLEASDWNLLAQELEDDAPRLSEIAKGRSKDAERWDEKLTIDVREDELEAFYDAYADEFGEFHATDTRC